jgi:hypothetical protein
MIPNRLVQHSDLQNWDACHNILEMDGHGHTSSSVAKTQLTGSAPNLDCGGGDLQTELRHNRLRLA